MLTKIGSLGYGGQSLDTLLPKILTELQGLTLSGPLAGAAANANLPVPEGIDIQDTLVKVLLFNGGVFTDITPQTTIRLLEAKGTMTLAGVVAGDKVSVNSQIYTFQTLAITPSTNVPPYVVPVGANDAATALNLAHTITGQDAQLSATAAGDVVSIFDNQEGTAGNVIALSVAASNGHVTDSGANLAGGGLQNAIQVSSDTTGGQVFALWFKKSRLIGQA